MQLWLLKPLEHQQRKNNLCYEVFFEALLKSLGFYFGVFVLIIILYLWLVINYMYDIFIILHLIILLGSSIGFIFSYL